MKKATTLKELDDCIWEVDYDIWEDMEWTSDKANVNRVGRREIGRRRNVIC